MMMSITYFGIIFPDLSDRLPHGHYVFHGPMENEAVVKKRYRL